MRMVECTEALTYDDIQIVPSYSSIKSRKHCSIDTKLSANRILKTPIVSSPMSTVTGVLMARTLDVRYRAAGAVHRFMSVDVQVEAIKMLASDGVLNIIGTIGIGNDAEHRVTRLVEAGANVILIDVAHGHHSRVDDTIRFCKTEFQHIDVIAGNVATGKAYRFLVNCGADGVRVGIGGGSLCSTRIQTGVGVPSISSIVDCYGEKLLMKSRATIIADGGIRYAGDVAKAIACGADSVMLGSMLAGTDEAPGETIISGFGSNTQRYKRYMGSASVESKQMAGMDIEHVEGHSTMVRHKGSVKHIIDDIVDGLRSAMSYVGARDIAEFRRNATFVKVTPNGVTEAKPHLLE